MVDWRSYGVNDLWQTRCMTKISIPMAPEPVGRQRAWPAISIAEAHAALTAPGSPFEMEELELHGRRVRTWRHGPKSLIDVFRASQAFADRAFIVYGEERVSYDAFGRAAIALADSLIARGVRPRDRVAVLMRNLPEWPVAFFGAALAGAIVVPLNAWLSAAELIYALSDCGAVAGVFDAERYTRVQASLGTCGALRHIVICRRPLSDSAAAGTHDLERIIGHPAEWHSLAPVHAPPVVVNPEDDATLFYSSGTSGEPKAALAAHRATTIAILGTQLSQARTFLRRGDPHPKPDAGALQPCHIVAIPLFHVTACFALLSGAMIAGSRLVFMHKFEPEAMLALVERERATHFVGVPTIPQMLLAHPARARYDLSSMSMMTYGGASPPRDLGRRLAQMWPRIATGVGWGMTETCATFTHQLAEDYAYRPDSCGPAIPVGEMKIVDAQGNRLPAGEVGELWVYGPSIVRGYWNKPELTAASFQDGWLKTGDLARVDEEGFCFIVDRLKDVVIRGGENIYSVEVEAALLTHDAVLEAAVVAVPHPSLGEVPGAVVCIRPGTGATEAELRAHVSRQLAPYKVPVAVVLWTDPLPRNAAGKVLKWDLRRLFDSLVQEQ